MSGSYINTELRKEVITRASRRCEYCLIHEDDTFLGCQVDHIISEKHEVGTELLNLPCACAYCNRRKGSDIATLDEKGNLIALFNPRTQQWGDHFGFSGLQIIGKTLVGRATGKLLRFNDPQRIEERRMHIGSLYKFPPNHRPTHHFVCVPSCDYPSTRLPTATLSLSDKTLYGTA